MEVLYKPSFLRDFKRLQPEIQEEARERISLFNDVTNHKKLKVHKLKGKLQRYYSFSVTYSHRIVFAYETKNRVVFIAIGDHDIYK